MKRFITLFICFVLIFPAVTSAQLKSQQPEKINFASLLRYGLQPAGLVGLIGLDPNRLHVSQSYTLSYMTLGGKAISQGVYLNSMQYNFSVPLSVNVEWGLMHSPMAAVGVNSPFQNGLFISRAGLEYKPSDNFQIGIQYSTYPDYYYRRDYLGRPGWR